MNLQSQTLTGEVLRMKIVFFSSIKNLLTFELQEKPFKNYIPVSDEDLRTYLEQNRTEPDIANIRTEHEPNPIL